MIDLFRFLFACIRYSDKIWRVRLKKGNFGWSGKMNWSFDDMGTHLVYRFIKYSLIVMLNKRD
jgi:hypothetical protein